MKLNIKLLEYTFEISTPLRIGSGIQVGVLNLTQHPSRGEYFIPGNTLRGLIGLQLLKLYCINPENAIKCEECENRNRCPHWVLIKNNSHGEGAYFHFGKIQGKEEEDFVIDHITGTRLYRDTKTVVKEEAPFIYEVLIAKKDKETNLNGNIYLINTNNELLEKLKNGMFACRNQCLGGKRSWGWGYIENVKVKVNDAPEISLFNDKSRENSNTFEISIQTPLPINSIYGNIENSIKESLKQLAEAFQSLINHVPKVNKIEIKKFSLKPISYWNEVKNKPYRTWALAERTPISIKTDNTIAMEKLLTLAKVTGITHNNQWYTKMGYGVTNLNTER